MISFVIVEELYCDRTTIRESTIQYRDILDWEDFQWLIGFQLHIHRCGECKDIQDVDIDGHQSQCSWTTTSVLYWKRYNAIRSKPYIVKENFTVNNWRDLCGSSKNNFYSSNGQHVPSTFKDSLLAVDSDRSNNVNCGNREKIFWLLFSVVYIWKPVPE